MEGAGEVSVLSGGLGEPRGIVERIGFSGLILFSLGIALSITLAQASFYGLVLLPWLVGAVLARRVSLPRSRIVYAGAALLAAYIIATAFGIDRVVSLKYLKKVGLFFILFLSPVFLTSKRRLDLLLTLFIIAITANAVYGIAEWLFNLDYYRTHGHHIGGTFRFYVTFGGVLVVSSMVTYGRIWLKGPLKYRLAYGVSFAVQVLALLLTRERNALVGLITGVLLFTFFAKRRYLLPVLAIVIGAALLLPHPLRDKVVRTRFTEAVVKMRLNMWTRSFPVIRKHPISGVGPRNVKEAFNRETPEFGMRYRHVHNNYLQILLELGLIGFGAFLWLFAEGLVGAVRCHFKHRDTDHFLSLTSLSAASAIAGFLAAGLFEFNFGDSEVLMPILLLLGVIVAIERGLSVRPSLPSSPPEKRDIEYHRGEILNAKSEALNNIQ